MIDIDKINANAAGATVSDAPLYQVGMEIGLVDPITKDFSKEAIEWFTIVYIEMDEELPIGWLYLMPADLEGKAIYTKVTPAGAVNFSDMVETISDYIVLP